MIVETAVAGQTAVIGAMVDSVNEVLELAESDIAPPPPFGARVRVDYLIGLGRRESKFVLVIDIDRVVAAEEILDLVTAADAETAIAAAAPEPADA